MNNSVRFGVVAGETSGDILGSVLLKGLQQYYLGTEFIGIGGPQMQQCGMRMWWQYTELSVRGYAEVIKHLPKILSIRRQILKRFLEQHIEVFIGIDAPDFNLGLEIKLKKHKIKTVHFISPSIWAWRPERIEKIRKATDLVLCIFPFEPQIYHRYGINACYVGNPLANIIDLDIDSITYKKQLGIDAEAITIAVLPGSNQSEINYNLLPFLQAVKILLVNNPRLQVLLPTLTHLRAQVSNLVEQTGLRDNICISLDNARQVLAACDVALIASGTATLEAALLKKPMVIGYKVHRLTATIMRRQKLQPWIGLPNILSNSFVVPELLQEKATAPALADAVQYWLDSPMRVQKLKQHFKQLHLQLRRDTAQLSAQAIANLICNK